MVTRNRLMSGGAGDMVFDLLNGVFMVLVIIVTVYPFWNQLLVSLADTPELYSIYPLWYPKSINFDSYRAILHYSQIWRGYWNTVVRTVLGTAMGVFFTALVAYPLSKRRLPLNRPITFLILFTMLFSGGLIPGFLLITRTLKLTNTVWALVLPPLIAPFNVFIVRNYFKSIPAELEESMSIDGAGHMTIFLRIIVPLSVPVLATIALWIGVGHWQAWFDALLYTPDPDKWVLQMVIRKILILNRPQDGYQAVQSTFGDPNAVDERQLKSGVIIISILPMLAIYPFIQKYFVKGIMLGSVKG